MAIDRAGAGINRAVISAANKISTKCSRAENHVGDPVDMRSAKTMIAR